LGCFFGLGLNLFACCVKKKSKYVKFSQKSQGNGAGLFFV